MTTNVKGVGQETRIELIFLCFLDINIYRNSSARPARQRRSCVFRTRPRQALSIAAARPPAASGLKHRGRRAGLASSGETAHFSSTVRLPAPRCADLRASTAPQQPHSAWANRAAAPQAGRVARGSWPIESADVGDRCMQLNRE